MKKTVLWVGGILLLVLLAPAAIRWFPHILSSLTPEAPPEPESREQITVAEYNQVQNGMTYEQVVQIVGFEGTLDGEERVTDDSGRAARLTAYTWKNGSFGGYMNTVFQDGRLVMKDQYALP
jgi:hypothetical protein